MISFETYFGKGKLLIKNYDQKLSQIFSKRLHEISNLD